MTTDRTNLNFTIAIPIGKIMEECLKSMKILAFSKLVKRKYGGLYRTLYDQLLWLSRPIAIVLNNPIFGEFLYTQNDQL